MGIKKMRIRIGRDGRTQIQVEGGQGDDCIAFTHSLEEALGRVEQRVLTADHDAPDAAVLQAQQHARQRG